MFNLPLPLPLPLPYPTALPYPKQMQRAGSREVPGGLRGRMRGVRLRVPGEHSRESDSERERGGASE